MNRSMEKLYSKTTASMQHSYIREILKVTKGVPGMMSFAGGLPSPASFPKQLLAELFSDVITQEGDDVLQYGASDGDLAFKQIIKKFEEAPYLSDDEIMIVLPSKLRHGLLSKAICISKFKTLSIFTAPAGMP